MLRFNVLVQVGVERGDPGAGGQAAREVGAARRARRAQQRVQHVARRPHVARAPRAAAPAAAPAAAARAYGGQRRVGSSPDNCSTRFSCNIAVTNILHYVYSI